MLYLVKGAKHTEIYLVDVSKDSKILTLILSEKPTRTHINGTRINLIFLI